MQRRILLVLALVLTATAAFAHGQSQTISQQKLSFEYRYNLAADDPANNYFAWTLERPGPNGATEQRIV
ncbi:MAG: hypothetical protein LBK64_03340, partial [Spirochaetaceae bacterium]|nr:hypothetical protein [Spirochaetaceae bacterium]